MGTILFISLIINVYFYGAIQVLRNADGGSGVNFSGKKRYESVKSNVSSVIRVSSGWVGVKFPEIKRYCRVVGFLPHGG